MTGKEKLQLCFDEFAKLNKDSKELDDAFEKIVVCFAELLQEGDQKTVLQYANEPKIDWQTIAAIEGILRVYPENNYYLRLLNAVYKLKDFVPFEHSFWIKVHDADYFSRRAFSTAVRLAALGDPDALYETALCLASGWGVEEDEAAAETLLDTALIEKYPKAETALAVLHADAETKEKYKETFKKFRDAPTKELNAEAAEMALLAKGTIYSERNHIIYLERAAGKGHVPSMLKAARFWVKQPGFCCRMDKIRKFGKMASDAGDPEGLAVIAQSLESIGTVRAEKEAWMFYTDAEKKGSHTAKDKCEKARSEQKPAYIEGLTAYRDGDYQKAYNALYPLYLLGNPRALQLCAEMVDKQQAKAGSAEELYRLYKDDYQKTRSARKAMTLCEICASRKEYQEAVKWGKIAADNVIPEAYSMMVRLGAVQGDEELAKAYSYHAAQYGDALGQYFYALRLTEQAYHHHLDSQLREYDTAIEYAKKAKQGGIEPADELIREIQSRKSHIEWYLMDKEMREFEMQRAREEADRRQEEEDRNRWIAQVGEEIAARNRIYSQSFGIEDNFGNSGRLNSLTGQYEMNDGRRGYVDEASLRKLQSESLQNALKNIYGK